MDVFVRVHASAIGACMHANTRAHTCAQRHARRFWRTGFGRLPSLSVCSILHVARCMLWYMLHVARCMLYVVCCTVNGARCTGAAPTTVDSTGFDRQPARIAAHRPPGQPDRLVRAAARLAPEPRRVLAAVRRRRAAQDRPVPFLAPFPLCARACSHSSHTWERRGLFPFGLYAIRTMPKRKRWMCVPIVGLTGGGTCASTASLSH